VGFHLSQLEAGISEPIQKQSSHHDSGYDTQLKSHFQKPKVLNRGGDVAVVIGARQSSTGAQSIFSGNICLPLRSFITTP